MPVAEFAALLDEPDAVVLMSALPSFEAPPSWLNDEDTAIGNWTAAFVGDDRTTCVRAALACLRRVLSHMPPPDEALASSLEDLEAKALVIEQWLADPEFEAIAPAMIDRTRQTRAWNHGDTVDAWIGEVADFAIYAIAVPDQMPAWAVGASSQANAALAAICSVRALVRDDYTHAVATLEIARTVCGACAL